MLFHGHLFDRDSPSRAKLIATLHLELETRLGAGARVVTSPSERRLYTRDLADLPGWLEKALFRTMPLLVVQPRDSQQIAAVLRLAGERRIPVVPRGIASTAFGGPVPTRNGIVLDLSPMRAVGDLSTNPSPSITVEAGARFGDIQDHLQRLGYVLPVYPSNRLGTVGGWLASGGLGVNALKYGHVGRWVDGIEVVTMDGTVRWLRNDDPEFGLFVGTEGQMGVISRATLRVLPRPSVRIPHLLSFDSAASALQFAGAMNARGVRPATISFLSSELIDMLGEMDRLGHREDDAAPTGGELQWVDPSTGRHSLLVFCDDDHSEAGLRAELAGRSDVRLADRGRAGQVWAERYFPMRIRWLGPSLLAGQVVLPLEKTAAFLEEAGRLSQRWGLRLATECHILPPVEDEAGHTAGNGSLRALAILMFPTNHTKPSYPAHLAFVSLLDSIGSRWHGRPYNLGIWHAPYRGDKYSEARLAQLRQAKRRLDPRGLLNPGKFWGVGSRFMGLTGLPFQPALFKLGMSLLEAATPAVSMVMDRMKDGNGRSQSADTRSPVVTDRGFRVEPSPRAYDTSPSGDLLLTATRCTSCGNCISVCPAYLQTQDERTVARGKLWLAARVASGKRFDPDAADMAHLCMRCRACEEVCQVHLPLMEAWEQLEWLLRYHRQMPLESIRGFLAEVESKPEYHDLIGLKRPGGLLAQAWLNAQVATPGNVDAMDRASEDETEEPGHPGSDHAGRFHIEVSPAPPMGQPIGKYRIDRNDFCVNCGHCGESCVYGVHFRNPDDPRRMAAPADHRCRACFRCVQECPRQALSISLSPAFESLGRGPYTPDIVLSLADQANEGRIPVTGAGYRGPFAGEGFDGMWTDMSEIVRPTRDGIHGREYISTAIDLGRRPLRLRLDETGALAVPMPRSLEVPIPVLFGELPIHGDEPKVARAIRRAAAELRTFVLGGHGNSAALAQTEDGPEVMDSMARLKDASPDIVVVVKVPLGRAAAERALRLTEAGVEVIHLAANWDGICQDGTPLHEALPVVHQQLVSANLRDAVTLLAGGGIAAAELVPKAIILGADGVVIDLPLLAALGCPLNSGCFEGSGCASTLQEMDVRWGSQRIVNLMAAWRNQLLEVLGAMGMREVRRLRGERGRALFARKLDAESFAPLFQR